VDKSSFFYTFLSKNRFFLFHIFSKELQVDVWKKVAFLKQAKPMIDIQFELPQMLSTGS